MASIQDFLKLERENRGLTQRETSELMGIGGAYSKIENGLTPIKPWHFVLFCQSVRPSIDPLSALGAFKDFKMFSPARLRSAMKRRGMTKSSLAREMSLGKQAPVSYWCSEKSVPNPENLAKLEQVLGLGKDDLQSSFHRQVRRLLEKGVDVSTFAKPRGKSNRASSRRSKVQVAKMGKSTKLRSAKPIMSTNGDERVLVLLSKKVFLMQKPALQALDPDMLAFEGVK